MKKQEYNKNDREQELTLKDGRKLYKTHNGFKSFVESKKGISIEVTDEYYNTSKKCKA